jgi:hypothetical protein
MKPSPTGNYDNLTFQGGYLSHLSTSILLLFSNLWFLILSYCTEFFLLTFFFNCFLIQYYPSL